MKKATIFVAAALLLATAVTAGEWTALNSSQEPFTVQVLEADGNRTILHYAVNRYLTENITIDGRSFTLLQKLSKESMIEEKGYPRLPRICRSIIIPDEGVMDWEVISSNYIEMTDINIAPSKGHFPRTIDPATVPYTFAEVYQNDAFFPADLVNIRKPYVFRDLRGAVVELNAFQYNPISRTLRIYTDVTVEVKKTAPGGENLLLRREPLNKIDQQFHKIYRRHFVNYGNQDYPHLFEVGGMLVICYDDFMDEMEPFVAWKNQRGIPTTLVPVSQAGSTPDAIKTYVRDYYYQNDLAFLLLVGDAPQIPTFTSGSDPVYGLLVGSDSYPEIFVGRFSAENRDQVQTQVDRTITYEKYPDPAGNWYHMGLGDADESGPCNPEQYDFQHITNIALDLLRWNYTQVDSVYTTFGGTTQMIADFLNDGRSIFNYAGHGWTTGMGPVNFSNSDVNNLVNDNKLTHLVAIACQPGNFVSTTCFGEAWLRATNSVTGQPTGAIATYLSKVSQSWFPPYDMQDEGIDLLVSDSVVTFGGMCFNGSGLMIDLHGSMGEWEFENWTIFGDPSVYLRSTTPFELTVIHDPVLTVGASSFDVTVSGPGGPLAEAMVCAMNNEVYASGFTDPSGQVTLNFDPPPVIPGVLTLTVTRSNPIPYVAELYIIVPLGPYVVYNDHAVQDDITGNNNGQLDYGETSHLSITVENVGVAPATAVTLNISTGDPLLTILDGTEFVGDIPAGGLVTADHGFLVELDPSVENGHPLVLTLQAVGDSTWESSFSIIAHAPECQYTSNTVDDPPPGNQNGNLDPGESGTITVEIINAGSSTVTDLSVELSTADPYVTIPAGAVNVGPVPPDSTASAAFDISASPACPQGYVAALDLAFSGNGYQGSDSFTMTIGDPLYDPTGPDTYGYRAYDPFDTPENPVYEWTEICADSGGQGTLVPFVNDDQVFQYELPFTFQYYGVDYDSFTVATNGWIAMGIVAEDDYSNSAIPDADGPPNMIAPYWEDLSPQRTNSGRVWRWFDEANHCLVVEYNHVEQYSPTGSFETFQVILLDPEYYQTVTGDGRILFQYKDMSTTAQSEGTVGIENAAETDGLQYLYDGGYDPHAHPIADHFAILFTTPTEALELDVTLTPYNPPIQIPASGGSFDYNIEVANNGAAPAICDIWCDATLPGGTVVGPLLGPVYVTLAVGFVGDRDRTQAVPARAPSGIYTYNGYVGVYPSVIYDEDHFNFEKLTTGAGAMVSDWANTGEPFEDWFATGNEAIPEAYSLDQNYPNPFNPMTTVRFTLPQASQVTLTIYDLQGRRVADLVDGLRDAGMHEVSWDAGDLASGLYFCRIQAGDFSAVKKMMLMK